MRRARRFLLLLIAVIVAAIAVVYNAQRATQARNAPPPTIKLPEAVSVRANDWTWEETRAGKAIVRVWAKDLRQSADNSKTELTGVELHLFHKDGQTYDRVTSAAAELDMASGILYSDGEVSITMGLSGDKQKPTGRLVDIKTSGAKFEIKTGKASTDRAASFRFDRGEGRSVGANYDPVTRELLMHKEVALKWTGDNPSEMPMEVEAGSLAYRESESKILLTPWSKFKRGTLSMEAAGSVVTLKDGYIELVEALSAKGVDAAPDRQVEYAAEELRLRFNENGVLHGVSGDRSARLVSASPTSNTTVNAGRLDLEFEVAGSDSLLKRAVATGGTTVEARPIPRKGALPSETKILKSEIVNLAMRTGGREMEKAETDSPGTLEFVPNRPGQRRRIINANRMNVEYGSDNQIKTFTALDVSTRTDPEPVKGKTATPPTLTWSKGMAAHFAPETGAVQTIEQWDNFRYQEGDQRAKADRAVLEQRRDLMILTGAARVWDRTGSTDADRMEMRGKSSEFEAIGNVSSTRLPDKKKDKDRALLGGNEPIQAKATKMTSSQDNSLIVYEGNALMWQGANRLEADRIEIDRKNGRLQANGKVVSQLLDKPEPSKKTPKPEAVFTTVRAPELVYLEKDRLAHYRGGTTLHRTDMVVTATELRAWLKEDESGSSLDRAHADGNVKIVQRTPVRTRTGVSEHAEYYVADGKVVLSGGLPQLTDTAKGTTRGRILTYFSTGDHLLVEGDLRKPVESRLLRQPK
jgi:lipopolysaccharide export system protein LptA